MLLALDNNKDSSGRPIFIGRNSIKNLQKQTLNDINSMRTRRDNITNSSTKLSAKLDSEKILIFYCSF